ncbi:FAD-dependent oxidoreductase [Phytoactinopolyspora limicola]|uniref:FAD-dependent oxidoreductase n=1 Tax=Phytoactinopolyspora limicola TaxID=2715536 RepID=UPI00140C157A
MFRPHQLYVRVARRMRGRYRLTHVDVLNQTTVDDGIGLALYGVDTYPVRRYACRDASTGQMGVAVALSATHIAYAVTRMESTFASWESPPTLPPRMPPAIGALSRTSTSRRCDSARRQGAKNSTSRR